MGRMDPVRAAAFPVVSGPPLPAPPRPHVLVPHAEVAREAERLWHERGRPTGEDEPIWLEAERRLRVRMESPPMITPPAKRKAKAAGVRPR